jgi:hypothetical protein
MSKIVQAVNSMVARPANIGSVIAGESAGELYFLYRGKYKWSIAKQDADFGLWYYPGKATIEELSRYQGPDWEDEPLVYYSTKDIGTHEAKASFAELYTLVKEKLYGMDKLLDEIIEDDIPF